MVVGGGVVVVGGKILGVRVGVVRLVEGGVRSGCYWERLW